MEAQICSDGEKLGPVAGRIVAEVLIGIIAANKDSLFHCEEPWKPEGCENSSDPYTMVDFLKYAGVYEPIEIKEGW